MTPKTVAIGAALALALVSTGVGAQNVIFTTTGQKMKRDCHSKEERLQKACMTFAKLVAAVIIENRTAIGCKLLYKEEGCHDQRVCMERGVPDGQLRDIMVKYLDDHPEQLDSVAWLLAERAFAEAFPCPK